MNTPSPQTIPSLDTLRRMRIKLFASLLLTGWLPMLVLGGYGFWLHRAPSLPGPLPFFVTTAAIVAAVAWCMSGLLFRPVSLWAAHLNRQCRTLRHLTQQLAQAVERLKKAKRMSLDNSPHWN